MGGLLTAHSMNSKVKRSRTEGYLFQNLEMEEFTESLFFVLIMIVICIKMGVILIKHSTLLEIINMLNNNDNKPQDCDEHRIQENYDKIGRFGTITFIVAVIITVLIKATGPLTKNDGMRSFKIWVPYSLENSTSYWLTYLFHLVASMIAAETSVAADTFVIVMMLQLSAQLEILAHRIQNYPRLRMNEQKTFGKWIQHHNFLYTFAKKLNDVYSTIFFVLLLVTTLDVCTCTYFLATLRITSMKFWSMTFSLLCVMFEICLYCFQGSFLMEKENQNPKYSVNVIVLLVGDLGGAKLLLVRNPWRLRDGCRKMSSWSRLLSSRHTKVSPACCVISSCPITTHLPVVRRGQHGNRICSIQHGLGFIVEKIKERHHPNN
ncbi:odorant receptor 46a-like [Belonocnema kinseyi]|uniref:odorant receptor 46a-like n=1 Tax=Belonocnema kinseyi TaxID=2817044 RepID=UPI00143CCDAF|nr:odorant receptor 46a-like [Belonocnema kinseyi]